jgi:hypothetical protein
MKRKIQHNAVNNQEDEDSCAYSIYMPDDAPVKKEEDKSAEKGSGELFSRVSGNNDELTSKGE